MVASVNAERLTIRHCHATEEFNACVTLQKEVWNFDDVDLIPLRMFVVASKIGGQVIGCFDGADLVGFALSIPGTRSGQAYLHSHMLAVRDTYRNAGLGRRLKLAQRDDGVARGFDLIEWTFDPLEIKNAFLNIARLGAIARRYTINQYGYSSSPLQGGLPTDRLVAEWWLRSKRVTGLLDEGMTPKVDVTLRIEVPGAIYEWKKSAGTRELAREVQSRNREMFLKAFTDGLAVLGYEKDEKGNGGFLLGRWGEDWSYASSE